MKAIVLKKKVIDGTTHILVVFDNHGTNELSIGVECHFDPISTNNTVDYWLHAEYYSIKSFDKVLKIFNGIK